MDVLSAMNLLKDNGLLLNSLMRRNKMCMSYKIKGTTARCTRKGRASETEQEVASVRLYKKMLLHDLLSAWLTGILFRSPVSPAKPLLAAGSKGTRSCRAVAEELTGYSGFRNRNEEKGSSGY